MALPFVWLILGTVWWVVIVLVGLAAILLSPRSKRRRNALVYGLALPLSVALGWQIPLVAVWYAIPVAFVPMLVFLSMKSMLGAG